MSFEFAQLSKSVLPHLADMIREKPSAAICLVHMLRIATRRNGVSCYAHHIADVSGLSIDAVKQGMRYLRKHHWLRQSAIRGNYIINSHAIWMDLRKRLPLSKYHDFLPFGPRPHHRKWEVTKVEDDQQTTLQPEEPQ
jgi:hypothetical protein